MVVATGGAGSNWPHVAVPFHVDGCTQKSRVLLHQECRYAVSKVSGSMLSFVREVFNWFIKCRFVPLHCLSPLVNSPNRMIRWGAHSGHVIRPVQATLKDASLDAGEIYPTKKLIVVDPEDSLEFFFAGIAPDVTKSSLRKHTEEWRRPPQERSLIGLLRWARDYGRPGVRAFRTQYEPLWYWRQGHSCMGYYSRWHCQHT